MCPCRAKKLLILSRSEYLVILTPHRYRRTSTTVSSPSVRGGHAPETRPASSDMPPHHPACMTSPPGCVRSAHRNTLEQQPGQTHSKIPSV